VGSKEIEDKHHHAWADFKEEEEEEVEHASAKEKVAR
jgi:hypothetical protein